MAKPRVLLSAYACEPDRGSEPAVGWNFAVAAAKECEVWVVTRANNRGAIEKKAEAVSVHWVYYDLPSWGLFLKKHLRMTSLYYLLWQVGVQKTIRRVCRANEIDVIHHVTFGSA